MEFTSKLKLKEHIIRSVHTHVAGIIDFPVRHNISFTDVMGVQVARYLEEDLAYESLLHFMIGLTPDMDADVYIYDADTYDGITMNEIVEMLQESDMYVEVG